MPPLVPTPDDDRYDGGDGGSDDTEEKEPTSQLLVGASVWYKLVTSNFDVHGKRHPLGGRHHPHVDIEEGFAYIYSRGTQ